MGGQREHEKVATNYINWDYLCKISPGLFLVLCGLILLAFFVWAQLEFGILQFLWDYTFGRNTLT